MPNPLILAAARNSACRRFVSSSRLARPLVERFVAGDSTADALEVLRALADDKIMSTVDYLAEETCSLADAEKIVAMYLEILAKLEAYGLAKMAEVSIKLSAIGLSLPQKTGSDSARAHALKICAAADKIGTTVTIDMEQPHQVEDTLAVYDDLRLSHSNVGIVLQSYLPRTENDCRRLATESARIRLCKGAYAYQPHTTWTSARQVDRSYVRCMNILLSGNGYPMFATHDPRLLSIATKRIWEMKRQPDSYEFQMLYGIRPIEQKRLSAAGHQVRVYIPYGTNWYGYLMRRLAERPQNLRLLGKALLGGS